MNCSILEQTGGKQPTRASPNAKRFSADTLYNLNIQAKDKGKRDEQPSFPQVGN